jgi:hypothetical protein
MRLFLSVHKKNLHEVFPFFLEFSPSPHPRSIYLLPPAELTSTSSIQGEKYIWGRGSSLVMQVYMYIQ